MRIKLINKINYLFLLILFCISFNCPVMANEFISIDEWDYSVDNGYGFIEGYNGDNTNLVIPNKINGVPIIAIKDSASINENVVSVEISNGIQQIGAGVFDTCHNLESITIPESVIDISKREYIGRAYINNCEKLKEINVDVNNKKYSSENGILYDKDKKNLLQYPMGKKDEKFIIPNSVENISDGALKDCNNLLEIVISENVMDITSEELLYCNNLENINVVVENDLFSSEDGVLYNKDKTELIFYPIHKNTETVKIPEGVKKIGNKAFYKNGLLSNVCLPNSITYIGVQAFYRCYGLKNIILSNNLEEIDENAFELCTGLMEITFPKTVTTIGWEAFYYSGLKKAIFLGEKPKYLDNYAFGRMDKEFTVSYDLAYWDSWKSFYKYPTQPFGKKTEDTFTTIEQITTANSSDIKSKKVKINSIKVLSVKKIKISLKRVKGANGYQIAIYKTKKNAKKNKKALVNKFVKKRISTIKSAKLKNKKTLYVKVRAYVLNDALKKNYCKWSSIKKVKMKK